MSVRQMAQVTGLNRSYLVEIERGAKNLTLSTMLKIVSSLDTTIHDLLSGIA